MMAESSHVRPITKLLETAFPGGQSEVKLKKGALFIQVLDSDGNDVSDQKILEALRSAMETEKKNEYVNDGWRAIQAAIESVTHADRIRKWMETDEAFEAKQREREGNTRK